MGYTCTRNNDWYYNCQPGSGGNNPPPPPNNTPAPPGNTPAPTPPPPSGPGGYKPDPPVPAKKIGCEYHPQAFNMSSPDLCATSSTCNRPWICYCAIRGGRTLPTG